MALIDARGTVLGKDQLLSIVWPDRVVEENNLPAQIAVLRKVFGADRHLIRTVAGRGYQFTGEIRATPATPAAPSPPSRMTNLPEAVSELIGREAELEEVAALVTEHRLVSLVGAGVLGREPTAAATAEACFQQALDVARRQGALSWELRAATSLARLWRGQQRVTQARQLLEPVYRRFTEGFETADLVAAKALLGSAR